MTSYIGVDFYGVLEINRDADVGAVNRAFKRLALKYHPSLAKSPSAAADFNGLCEAYAVLSDARLRAIYDAHGHDGLADKDVAWKYNGDSDGIFHRFFGTDNPFVFQDDRPHHFFSETRRSAVEKQIAPLRTIVAEVSLSDLFKAATIEVPFERRAIEHNGTFTTTPASVRVSLRKGMTTGSTIIVKGYGDAVVGHAQGDLAVTLSPIADGALSVAEGGNGDLKLVHPITLTEALCGAVVHYTTLDGRALSCRLNEVINPSSVRVVEREGLWRPDGRTRGDLRIVFEIKFPRSVSAEQKAELARILSV